MNLRIFQFFLVKRFNRFDQKKGSVKLVFDENPSTLGKVRKNSIYYPLNANKPTKLAIFELI